MAHSGGVAGAIAGSVQRPGRAAGLMRQIEEVLFLSRVHATEWENEETPWHLRKEDPTDAPLCSDVAPCMWNPHGEKVCCLPLCCAIAGKTSQSQTTS